LFGNVISGTQLGFGHLAWLLDERRSWLLSPVEVLEKKKLRQGGKSPGRKK